MKQLIIFLIVTIATLSLPSCRKDAQKPDAIITTEYDALGVEERFLPLGSTGLTFRVEKEIKKQTEIRLDDKQDHLLPGTIRLFKFDPKAEKWSQVEGSSFNEKINSVVAPALTPGLYTAAGWSANPAENALQRLCFDLDKGRQLYDHGLHASLADDLDRNDLTYNRVLGRLIDYLVFERTRCFIISRGVNCFECDITANEPVYPNNCPSVCPSPACCACITFSFRNRMIVPQLTSLQTQILCDSPPCEICPNGLSCPNENQQNTQVITPTLKPDYGFYKKIGLGDLLEKYETRIQLYAMTDAILGKNYPKPEPMLPAGNE